MLVLKVETPEASNDALPKLVVPSRNTICPVGAPLAELMDAINVTADPDAAFAGAVRVNLVASP